MTACPLFDAPGVELVKSPWCLYLKHCGALATCGPYRLEGDGRAVNREIRCVRCQVFGDESQPVERAIRDGVWG